MFIQFLENATEEHSEVLIDEHATSLDDDDLLEMMKEIAHQLKDSENQEESEDVSGLAVECHAELMRRVRNNHPLTTGTPTGFNP